MSAIQIEELDRLIADTRTELTRERRVKRRDAAQIERLLGKLAKLSAQRSRRMRYQFSN